MTLLEWAFLTTAHVHRLKTVANNNTFLQLFKMHLSQNSSGIELLLILNLILFILFLLYFQDRLYSINVNKKPATGQTNCYSLLQIQRQPYNKRCVYV